MKFLSQPFYVAEQFSGIPGKYVKVEDTIRGFKEIIEGKHDDLPEQAFYMVGTIEEAIEKAKIICDVLSSKMAYDIIRLDDKEKTVLADYFVICSGKSSTQVRALADYAIDEVEKNGGEVRRKEGMDEGRWVVVDFGDVILHVFNDETRLFYHLERLWSDGKNEEKIDS